MATPFDKHNYDFSDKCHEVAVKVLYPKLATAFGQTSESLSFADRGQLKEDFNQGIDRVMEFDTGASMSIQERFRRPSYAHYREVTATDANHATGRAGDFHKLTADLYAYGYINEDGTGFVEAVIVDVPTLKECYRSGLIAPGRNYYWRKKQTILSFPFEKLLEHNAVVLHLQRDGTFAFPQS